MIYGKKVGRGVLVARSIEFVLEDPCAIASSPSTSALRSSTVAMAPTRKRKTFARVDSDSDTDDVLEVMDEEGW